MNNHLSSHVGRLLALCLGMAVLLPTVASAQSIWLDPERPQGVSVEFFKPDFTTTDDVTFFSGAYVMSGRYHLTPLIGIIADVPIAHFGVDGGGIDQSDTGMGNPYVGVEIGARERPFYADIGVRIPVDGDDNALTSGLASELGRMEAYFGEVLAISGHGNYRLQMPGERLSNLSLRLRGGPNLWVFTEDSFEDDVDLLANYAAQLWYDANRIQVGAGAVGRALLTEGEIDFAERTAHQFGASVLGMYRGVQPGVHFLLPFDDDDFGDIVDYAVGVSLTVPVR